MPKKRIRSIGQIAFSASQTVSLDLPREFIATQYMLELTGELVVGVAAATIHNEAPQALIRRIEIERDGQVPVVIDGGALAFYNLITSHVLPDRQSPVATVGTNAFRAFLRLPMELMGSGNPRRTYLDTSRFNSLRMKITWGSIANVATAGVTGTAVLQNINLNVLSEELQNRAVDIAPGGFDDLVVSRLVEIFSGATTGGKIKLPRQDLYRGLILRSATDANDGRDLSDTQINSLKLRERLTLDTFEVSWNQLRSQNVQDAWIAQAFETPATGFQVQGYGFIDLIKTGIQDLLDPRSFTELDLLVDVAANTHITVYPIQVRPLQGA